MNISGAKLSGTNFGNYSVSYAALLGFTSGTYTINQPGYSYPLTMYPGWSFSNSTGGYSLDGSKQFPANTGRITSSGLLVEAAGINYQCSSTNVASSAWSAFGSGSAAASAVAAPDGSSTAVQLTFSANQSSAQWIISPQSSLPDSVTATISAWMRAVSGTTTASFNFSSDANADQFSPDFTLTTTWQRFSWTATSQAGSSLQFAVGSALNSGTYLVWGPQVEVGSSASSYIPNSSTTAGSTATRAADVVTQTYNGTATNVSVTTSGLGAMTYPAAGVTNLIPYSAINNQTGWSGYQASVTGQTLAPDGTNTAAIATFTGLNGAIYQGGFALTNGQTYTMSCWVKWISGSKNFYLVANPGSSTTTTAATSGWVRYSSTFTATSTSANIGVNADPSSTGVLAIWGFQLEQSSQANGYVPTTSAAATFTPSSPFTLSQAPFLNQNIQSVVVNGSSNSIIASLNFVTNKYTISTSFNSYSGISSVPGWSFSNSTGGYSLDGTQSFAANTPRITSAGLLVEAAATNLCTYSQTPGSWAGNAGWALTTGTPDPAGGTNGFTLSVGAGVGQNAYLFTQPITWAGGVPYTVSVWARTTSGTAKFSLDITSAGGGIDYFSSDFTATTTWQRFSWTYSPPSNGDFEICGASDYSAATIQFAFPQAELGSVATSYIPTPSNAAATRDADVVSLSYSGSPTLFSLVYTGGTTSITPGSPLNLGASSGGAWVGQNIQSVSIS